MRVVRADSPAEVRAFFDEFGPVVDAATAAHLLTIQGRPVSPSRVAQLANQGKCPSARLYGRIVVSLEWVLDPVVLFLP